MVPVAELESAVTHEGWLYAKYSEIAARGSFALVMTNTEHSWPIPP